MTPAMWSADQLGLLHYHASHALGDGVVCVKVMQPRTCPAMATMWWHGLWMHLWWAEYEHLNGQDLRSLIHARFQQAKRDQVEWKPS